MAQGIEAMREAAGRKTSRNNIKTRGKKENVSFPVIFKALLAKRPVREILAVCTTLLGAYIFISLGNHPNTGFSLVPSGYLGYLLSSGLFALLGWAAWGIPVLALGWSWLLLKSDYLWSHRLNGLIILMLDCSLLAGSGMPDDLTILWQTGLAGLGGGILGNCARYALLAISGRAGLYIFFLALLAVAVILIGNRSIAELWSHLRNGLGTARRLILRAKQPSTDKTEENLEPVKTRKGPASLSNTFPGGDIVIKPEPSAADAARAGHLDPAGKLLSRETASREDKDRSMETIAGEAPPRASGAPFVKPPLDLLREMASERAIDRQEIQNKVQVLEQTFANFGIEVKVLEVSCGPAVTRYELSPAPGVKVSRISSLADDLQLSLAARGLRLEVPIPGKAAVGIEIPNDKTSPVGLKNILSSPKFAELKNPLSLALGEDIAGNIVVAELNEMPHLLVAGATGSGKSVCVNSMIMSLLLNAHPDQVKLILIDPKKVELTAYNGIPHLLAPVVTDPKKAARVLKWMTAEMEHRYQQFTEAGVRDISRYNEHAEENLPFIVVIIDELADLMMVSPGDVEDSICRLAQMARAAGIHLIVSTQRPSVDVITGLIKANIPSRIAFAVSSQIDSRTILDGAGAEKLLGKGDMLYLPMGAIKSCRVQGAYVSDAEIIAVVEFLKSQGMNVEKTDEEVQLDTVIEQYEADADDDLFWDAVRLVVDEERLSASFLQRKLKVGYSRAARMVDMMEERGIVSAMGSDRKRRILISSEELEQILVRKRF